MQPDTAVTLYRIFTTALTELKETCMAHFIQTDELYKARRKIDRPLGFEALVVAELYNLLRRKIGENVFLDFPSNSNDRIDLAFFCHQSWVLSELKMYHSDTRNAYGGDFQKLKKIVDVDRSVQGMLVHFHFYENRNKPAQAFFQELYTSLPEGDYSRYLDCVGDSQKRHFLVLGFSRRE
jgi:hypothetical protein